MSQLRATVEELHNTHQFDVENCAAKALNKRLRDTYASLRETFSNATDADAVLKVTTKVEAAKHELIVTLDKAEGLLDDLDDVELSSELLRSETEKFKDQSEEYHKWKKCCCNMFAGCASNDHCVPKCFLGTTTILFILIGFAMAGLGMYALVALRFQGGQTLLDGFSNGAVVAIIVIGFGLAAISIAVCASTFKPTACCSKFVS